MNSLKNVPVKNSKVKTILVIGGAGFIGSHLCEALLIQGYYVICIDDLSSGNEKNLTLLQKDPNFKLLTPSTDNQFDYTSLESVHYVFHVAGLNPILDSKNSNLQSLLVNSEGLHKLLEKCVKDKAEFLYLSLADIYSGVASRLSLNNYFGSSERQEKLFSYYEAKRFGEALIEEYRKNHKLKARIVRVKDVYGPRMPLFGLYSLNTIINLFLKGEKITLLNDGLEIIFPTYISDVVYGLIKAMFSVETEGNVYYIINDHKYTLKSVTETLLSFSKNTISVKIITGDEIPLPQSPIDISLSKRDLRWAPTVSLEDGFSKTLTWFKKESAFPKKAFSEDIEIDKTLTKKDYSYEKTEIIKKSQKTALPKQTLFSKEPETLQQDENKENVAILESKDMVQKKEEKELVIAGKKEKITHREFTKFKVVFISLCLVFIFFGLLSPVFFSTYFAYKGVSSLLETKQNITDFNFESIDELSNTAEKSLRTSENSLNNLLWVFSLFHKREAFQEYTYLISAGKDVSQGLQSLSYSLEPLLSSVGVFLDQTDEAVNVKVLSNQVKANIVQTEEKIASAQGKMNTLTEENFPKVVWEKIVVLKVELQETKELLSQLQTLADVLPSLMGEEQDRAYLLVFQNNNEMRATGGFIGSYARVYVSGGKIKEIKVDDVYNPDGLLEDIQEPPAPLKEHLAVVEWGMRDANWSPDFPTSAADIERLYEMATKDDVSGVISIDLYTVEKLIEALGSITPVGYDEEITAENFFEKAEYYSEVGFTPGSTGKRDFLGAVAEQLLGKLVQLDAKELSLVFGSLYTSLEEKHILFSFDNVVLQEVIQARNWDGSVVSYSGDYLWIIDSNVGGNKANYYVTRTFKYMPQVDRDGNILGNLEINYLHEGKTETWPGGRYKNYVRIYVPLGAELIESEGFNSELKTSTDFGKTVFEGLVEVSIDSEHKVFVSYKLPNTLSITDESLKYSLYIQKQLGSIGDGFFLDLAWPQYLVLKEMNPEGDKSDTKVDYSGNLTNNSEFIFTFEK